MKKIRVLSLLFLMMSSAIFAGYRVYKSKIQDLTPPVISFENESLKVSVAVTQEELLADVKASDNRDGDVSDQIVIEKMSGLTKEGTRIITYAAIDSQNNVGRREREICYTDYKAPVFSLSGPLSFPMDSYVDILDYVSVKSPLDGDLSDRVKYSVENAINVDTPGEYPVSLRVMDSAGKQVYLDTSIEVYDRVYKDIQVQLKNYLIYVKKGAKFEPEKYFKEARIAHSYAASEKLPVKARDVEIRSKVDMKNAGTYTVDYFVEYEGRQGKSRLVVVIQ